MEALECILTRRSVRNFRPDPVPKDLLQKILDASNWAPSAKNSQPWRFHVLEGDKKDLLCSLMEQAIKMLVSVGVDTGSARASLEIMRQAPVLVVVSTPEPQWEATSSAIACAHESQSQSILASVMRVVTTTQIQSVGAAFQNMCLAAHALGLGSLWIGDVFFAQREIAELLCLKGDLMGAVSLGYTDVKVAPRPRNAWTEVTEFVE